MQKTQLEVREWLELPLSTRVKLASDFNLMRSGNSEVVDHRVVSDGYLYNDLSKISVELLRSHLNLMDSDEYDFYKLFNLLLQSYENKEGNKDESTNRSGDETNREEQEVEPIRERSILPEVVTEPKKRRGRTTNASSFRNGGTTGVRKSTKNNIG